MNKNKEKESIDKIVEQGLEEHKKGRTENLKSFLKKEYPELYKIYTDNQ